ncbi:MAG: ATP synthase F1 subunit gamma [Bacteroidetes bacterium]|jgi:F-type H+-transporting ATPase subunit gamma|nr:ATP synthase F1 subunit gamma [Bacteroidota bacterium]
MASLKEIRTRIASVKSTRQITSAMKMVSAAKLRKAQDHIIQLRPYANKLNEILSNLSSSLSVEENPYGEEREIENVLVVVFTGNRGLCGSFNANIVKSVTQQVHRKYRKQLHNKQLDIFCIGKKGADLLKGKGYLIKQVNTEIYDAISFKNILPIAEDIMSKFINKTYDRVDLCFNEFINASAYTVHYDQFLPIEQPENMDDVQHTDYIFEPDKEYIVKELIPRSLKIQFYRALLDSNASEHGARMTAMHQATDNATELVKQLTLDYNKARQAAITKEISEIVGGAEALKG